MIVLHKIDGQEVLLEPRQIQEVERIGSASVVKVGRGGIYIVSEGPQDIAALIEEAEQSLRPPVPSPPQPGETE